MSDSAKKMTIIKRGTAFERMAPRDLAFRDSMASARTMARFKVRGHCETCKRAVCENCGEPLHYLKGRKRHYCPDCSKGWKDVQGFCTYFQEPLTEEFREEVKANPCTHAWKRKQQRVS